MYICISITSYIYIYFLTLHNVINTTEKYKNYGIVTTMKPKIKN